MSVRVHVTIEIRDQSHNLALDLEESSSGDNPRYAASQVRKVLLLIAERADRAVTGVYGDLGDAAGSDYTRQLPTAKEWTT